MTQDGFDVRKIMGGSLEAVGPAVLRPDGDVSRTGIVHHMTATIVGSYVQGAAVPLSKIPELLRSVREMVEAHVDGADAPEADAAQGVRLPPASAPAVTIEDSVTDDHIICLEDGRKLKTLKRHLQSVYNLTPEEYRKRWGLPKDYPMVAPKYSRQRSAMARGAGLGKKSQAKR